MNAVPTPSFFDQFRELVYGSSPAEFVSAFPVEESVSRLRAATRRSIFSTLRVDAAVGSVSARAVRLQHVIPFVGNSFKPFFLGSFREVDGKAVLSGRFTMLWAVKAFLTVWFGFCALWTFLATLGVLGLAVGSRRQEPTVWIFPLVGIAMFTGGMFVVKSAKRWAGQDQEYLSRVIRDALSTKA
jgi:hypothetical protein